MSTIDRRKFADGDRVVVVRVRQEASPLDMERFVGIPTNVVRAHHSILSDRLIVYNLEVDGCKYVWFEDELDFCEPNNVQESSEDGHNLSDDDLICLLLKNS